MVTAQAGGISNKGTIFKLDGAGVVTTLYTFTGGADGKSPKAALVQGTDGNFYGTTSAGGSTNYGTVFMFDGVSSLTPLYSFTGAADGGDPEAPLVQGSDGNFYVPPQIRVYLRVSTGAPFSALRPPVLSPRFTHSQALRTDIIH